MSTANNVVRRFLADQPAVAAPKSNWRMGEKVEVVVDGTPMEGKVISAPFEHEDAWTLPIPSDAWVVRVDMNGDGGGEDYAVSGGKAIKALTHHQVEQILTFRRHHG